MAKYFPAIVALIFVLLVGEAFSGKISPAVAMGDGTCMGMIIKEVTASDGSFKVVTTAAEFNFEGNELSVSQGMSTARKLALFQLSEPDGFELVVNHPDHVVLSGNFFTVSVYGDSTCVISPTCRTVTVITGQFKPDYIGRHNGEVLMIDELGGLSMHTDRNSKSYQMEYAGQNSAAWRAVYHLDIGERLMLVVFPGKPFDWDKSFATNIVFTQASSGKQYGVLPPDWLIRKWSQYFDIMVLWHNGLYTPIDPKATYAGPYVVGNSTELARAVNMAHQTGMKVVLYTSFYYFYDKFKSSDDYFDQIQNLKKAYNIDGVYIDGMLSAASGHENQQIFINWEMIRRLRELFGGDGAIIYHGTSLGHQVATMPNVDAYCDATLNGENVPFESFEDPYVRYHVRKYGISNTVALWKPGPHPRTIGDRMIIDALLNMNGRMRYWAGVTAVEPTKSQPNIWVSDIDQNYRYYLERLLLLKQTKSMNPGNPLH